MEAMVKIAQAAITMMPPTSHFTAEHAAILARHKDVLLAWEDELVQQFYDTVLAHGPTRAIFRDGERQEREKTLRDWWQRTVNGPHDEQYFGWMAMVGLVHVVRKVENPMMLAMTNLLSDFVREKALGMATGIDGTPELVMAFQRLMQTVGAVITQGYDNARIAALYNIVGMEPALLDRLTQQNAQDALREVRGH